MIAQANPILDETLARQAREGDLSSFEELVCRYETRIYRFVSSRCANDSDAQEVTQDIFVAAYRGLPQFDPKRSFATWLFTIARRKCIDHYRGRRPSSEAEIPELTDANDPAAVLMEREAADDLWRVARTVLSPVQYDCLWLRYAEDLPVSEVARVMRRTQTHVKVLLFRARVRLDRALENPRVDGASAIRVGASHSRTAPRSALPISPAETVQLEV